ncbi:conserved hypothetical protein [Pediculus humanus corporis]|uniref:C2H2-type domain-containing protein n=1 Tax=Pediculus humanus subsp. corporis TaxID=121224 RepID=E0VAK7_PEDHC|nr:uncharacterized protein Phum_PHUM040370 [Pediculus humanus corporis]EEB10413.1 conserved hypothetical protein [Pediculus humanus corporis]
MKSRSKRFMYLTQLPIIEEENFSEINDDGNDILFPNPDVKNKYLNRKTFDILIKNKFKKKGSKKRQCNNELQKENKEIPLLSKYTSLTNIGSLINPYIKQTQQMWETNFGKKLLNGKDYFQENESDFKILHNNPFATNQEEVINGDSNTKKSFLTEPNNLIQSNKIYLESKFNERNEEMENCAIEKTKTKKIKKFRKKTMKTVGKSETTKPKNKTNVVLNKNDNFVNIKNNNEIVNGKTTQQEPIDNKIMQNIESRGVKVKTDLLQSDVLLSDATTCPTSLNNKNQRFLSKHIRSILENSMEKLECKFCKETCTNLNDLITHQKTHRKQTNVCIICDKVFNETVHFIHHMMNTHENVVDKSNSLKKIWINF